MQKQNTDKTISGDRPGINLENPSTSRDSPRNSEGNKKLLDKDSSSDDIMRPILPPNDKDGVSIDSLSSQQQKEKQIINSIFNKPYQRTR
jgi:hypothetical protein